MSVVNGYRDSHHVSSDDESDDSDKECNVWKRATVRKVPENVSNTEIEEVKPPPEPEKPVLKRKRNTIWSEVLQDQLISEDFEDCLLKNKPRNYGSRGKESYDYTLRYSDPRIERDSDCHMSDSSSSEGEPPKSRRKHSSSTRNNSKKFVKLDSAELAAARKINKVLNEKKFYLIQRIVKVVGIEKAMSLLSMTEQIEENGGMMIKSNARRRTPGGVYIQLLKSDKDVSQEMLDKIFEGEMSGIELKKYYAEKKKSKKKINKRKFNHNSKDKSNLESKEMTEACTNERNDEVVPMDAEEVPSNINSENSGLDNNVISVPVSEKNSTENNSDLEEGEIEE